VHHVSELAHEGHLLIAQGTLLECPQVLLQLLDIGRRRQANVYRRVGEREPVAHGGVGNGTVARPFPGPAKQPPPASRGVADDPGTIGAHMRKHLLFGAAMRRIVANHQHVQLAPRRQLTGETAIVAGHAHGQNLSVLFQLPQLLAKIWGESGRAS